MKFGLRSSVATRCLLACAMGALLAGCSSDVTRLAGFGTGSDPEYTGSIPTPAEPVQSAALGAPASGGAYGGSPAYSGGQSYGGVQSAPLDSPATGQPMYGAPGAQSSDGRTVVLGAGESLDTVSRRYSIPRQALMDVNGISDANSIRPGQQLLIPVYSASRGGWVAPSAATQQAAAPSNSAPARPSYGGTQSLGGQTATAQAPTADRQPGGRHRVQPGETLYSIGRTYKVSPNAIIQANRLENPNSVRIGTELVIPGAGQQQVAAAQQTQQVASPPPVSQESLQPQTLQQKADAVQQTTAPQQQTMQPQQAQGAQDAQQSQAPEQPRNQQVAMAPASGETANDAGAPATQAIAAGTFRWPVRGRVISSFGEKGNGGKNDGINISVPEGTSVRAAEDGVVAYAGNELKGYGNLVLIRHKDDWVTAYAHNSEISVQRGDSVTRGQVIAKAGQSGSVNAPQVHFEVRRNSTPVDPLKYLSEN